MGSEDVEMTSFALKAFNGLLPSGRDSRLWKERTEEFVGFLEEERRKMEGFRRELPLTIVIITDVIHEMKEEVNQWRKGVIRRPVLEQQLLDVKSSERREGEDEEQKEAKMEQNRSDMTDWVKTFQLWNDRPIDRDVGVNRGCDSVSKENTIEKAGESDPKPPLPLFPAAAAAPAGEGRPQMPVPLPIPMRRLSFVTPRTANSQALAVERHPFGSSPRGKTLVSPLPSTPLSLLEQQQGPKKTRRCWSAELHRKFLRAVDDLGGSQATPKQIRELMNVEGLTNDEVKSHLQKYRLHMRKSSHRPALKNKQALDLDSQSSSSSSSQDGLIGKDRRTSPSGSPQGPLELGRAGDWAFPISRCDDYEEDRRSVSYGCDGHSQRSIEV